MADTEYLQCQLTQQELLDAAGRLARANQAIARIADRKAEIAANLKAESQGHEAEATRLSLLITNGYEYRDVPVRVEMDTPEPGQATVTRPDTGAVVRVRPMSADEIAEARQGKLDLGAAE